MPSGASTAPTGIRRKDDDRNPNYEIYLKVSFAGGWSRSRLFFGWVRVIFEWVVFERISCKRIAV